MQICRVPASDGCPKQCKAKVAIALSATGLAEFGPASSAGGGLVGWRGPEVRCERCGGLVIVPNSPDVD